MMFDFNGRVALITGAVGNLGLATARAFHRAGAGTVLVDRSHDRLRQAFPGLAAAPDHFLAGGVDLTNASAVAEMVDEAHRRLGRLDVLVNTVGGFRGGKPIHEEDADTWDFLFTINVRTALACCRAVVPHFLKAGRGKIINVASRSALAGSGWYTAYSATKSAVVRLTEGLAEEVKEAGINVNCVLPGTIDTPQNRQERPAADTSKWVEPAAIADVILFLASDAARAVTGAVVPVFGRG
jgi:NAD(P)-dependent dehydrogenase (short-subunit alcohol dehydrogenase family)